MCPLLYLHALLYQQQVTHLFHHEFVLRINGLLWTWKANPGPQKEGNPTCRCTPDNPLQSSCPGPVLARAHHPGFPRAAKPRPRARRRGPEPRSRPAGSPCRPAGEPVPETRGRASPAGGAGREQRGRRWRREPARPPPPPAAELPPVSADCREEVAARVAAWAPAQPRAAAACGAPSRPPLRHGRASGERSPSKCPRPAAHRTTCRPRLSAPPRPATSAGGRLGALQKHRRLPPSRAGVRSAERCARSPPLSCCSSTRHRALLCLCTGRVGAGGSRSVSVAAPAGLPGATGSFLRLCGGASLFSQRSPVRVPHLAVRRGVGSGGLVVPQTHHGFSSAQPACGPCGLWEERNEAWVLSENGMPLTGVLPLGLLLCFGFCFSVEFL